MTWGICFVVYACWPCLVWAAIYVTIAQAFENRLSTSGADYHVQATSLIYLTQVDNVAFSDNYAGVLGPEAKDCVVLGPGVGKVAGLPGNGSNEWCKVTAL